MSALSGLQGSPSIERLCRLGGVARAGFYRHLQEQAPERADADLSDAIHRIVLGNKLYGYRRVSAELRRQGVAVNHKRVLRLMRKDNLLCLRKVGFVPKTTDSRHGFRILPNLVRDLVPSGIDQIWVADITYIRLDEAFVYLAVVLDAFSRRIVGWALEDHLRAELPLKALDMAVQTRRPPPKSLIHHSDRGVQYACNDYAAVLNAHAIAASMSGSGNPYDNAKAESFMKTLKHEEVNGRAWRTIDEARYDIKRFLETAYNRQRLHSALGYTSPVEFEAKLNHSRNIP
jgi:transposase InsO family protein